MPTLATFKTSLYTVFALIAFAANSVFCRLALGEQSIDAANFTIIRLLSGALLLIFILFIMSFRTKPADSPPSPAKQKGSWLSAAMLFIYAAGFSFAYVELDTATGALVLFGAVQITMILLSQFTIASLGIEKSRLSLMTWVGTLIAFAGFVYLMLPSLINKDSQAASTSLLGFVMMAVSGIAWGIYTLKGRGSKQPVVDTAFNFIRSIPLVLLLILVLIIELLDSQLSEKGIWLAIASGTFASAIGYSIWYKALGGLSSINAAVLQLLVPVIAALGGILFVGEAISFTFMLAAMLILGGILLVILGKQKEAKT
jgi:drug/metabolite transporter (DMT)-like permease